MAYEHREVIEAQYQNLSNERAQALVDYEYGRTSEDSAATMRAADRIVEIDAKRAALEKIATQFVQQQEQPQGNRYGLSKDEVEIAHGMASADPHLSQEQREQIYAQNKQKLQHMRAIGQYRDDQGIVRR